MAFSQSHSEKFQTSSINLSSTNIEFSYIKSLSSESINTLLTPHIVQFLFPI